MRKKSKSMLAILMAAAMMSSLCCVPAAAADISAAEETTEAFVDDTENQETEMTDSETMETDASEETEAEAGDTEEFFSEEEIPVADEEEIEAEEQDSDEVVLSAESEEQSVAAGDEEEEFTDAAGVETYEVGVNYGDKSEYISVTSENKDDVLEDRDGDARSIVYIPEQHRLILDNIDKKVKNISTAEMNNLTIELRGQNELDKGINSLHLKCTLIITGNGSLKIAGGEETFINCYGNLALDGAKLDLATTDEKKVTKAGIAVNGELEIKNKSEIHLKTQNDCIADYKSSNLAAKKPESRKITISDSSLTLESKNSRTIDTDKPVTIQDGSILNLQGGIYVTEQKKGATLIVKNSKINVNSNEETDSGYGIYADKVQISDNSNVTAKTTANSIKDTANVSAIRSQSMIDIANSTVRTEGPGYSLDAVGDININRGIVLADAVRKEVGNFETSIIAADDDGNYSAVNITDSWVDAAASIEGTRTVKNSVVFEKNEGKVTGNAVVPGNVEVRRNHKLRVVEPTTLTVPSGLAISNNGEISADCTSLKGKITGTAPVYTHSKLTQWVNDKTSHWKECTKCGTKLQKASHNYGAWKILKAAGLGLSGAREHYCATCNFAQSEDIAAIQVMQLQVKGAKKAVTLKWSKVSGADGYMIYGGKCGKKTSLKKTVGKNTRTWKQKKLKAGTYYKYYVVAYKVVNGKKMIIGQSSDMHAATTGKGYGYAKKITVNKSTLKLKTGKTAKIKATVKNTSKKVKDHTLRVRYISTNRDIATVNSKGKVTAKAKGTCYIYCYGLNGLTKKVKVTVR